MVQENRIHVMDTLRGLACLQVLLHHSIGIMKPMESTEICNILNNSFLSFLWAGPQAVTFFFMMSGFVLSIPFYSKKVVYKEFFIKRIFRIYGPFLITICLGVLLNNIYANHEPLPALNDWFLTLWQNKITTNEMVGFLLMKGDWKNVVTSLWSLPVELKVSLFIPIFIILIKKLNLVGGVFLILINIIFYMVCKRLGAQAFWPDFANFYYLTFFIAGGVLYKYHQLLIGFINRLNKPQIYALFTIAILLYTYRHIVNNLPNSLMQSAKIIPGDYMTLIASILFIGLAISDHAPKWLSNSKLLFLGKISFSLYLIHPIIIGIVAISLGNFIPVSIVVLLCIILSILAAIPFYLFIENPLQNLGRKVSKNSFKKLNINFKKNLSRGESYRNNSNL
jgi:peptidoglycan/LPS O-acetylase OafA/YrhL